MRTQKDFLREAFAKLEAIRDSMSTGELRLFEDMELRASQGPALTSNDVKFLERWHGELVKRGKEHDDFIARTKQAEASAKSD